MTGWLIADIISIFVTFIIFIFRAKLNIDEFLTITTIFSSFITVFISLTTLYKIIAYKKGKEVSGGTIFTLSSAGVGLIIMVISGIIMFLTKSQPTDITSGFPAGALGAIILVTCVPPCFMCSLIGVVICVISNRKDKNSSDKEEK